MSAVIQLDDLPREETRLFEIEEGLKEILAEIETEKARSCHGRKISLLTAKKFQQEAISHPYATASKCVLVVVGLMGLPMALIGSWACFNYYRFTPIDQVFTNIPAMINYSNEGQAITYLIQGVEFILIPTTILLFNKPYHKAQTVTLRNIYLEKIAKSTINPSQVFFLINRANSDLAKHGHLPLPMGNSAEEINHLQNQLESIEEELERDKCKLLSLKHIIYLVACEILREVKCSSKLSILKKGFFSFFLIGATTSAWHPLIMGIFGNLAPFNQQSPLGLASEDPQILEETTGLYSNLGHIPEYLASGLLISGLSVKILFGEKYQRIRLQLIDQIYDKHIKNSELDSRVSDLLYRKKWQERENS